LAAGRRDRYAKLLAFWGVSVPQHLNAAYALYFLPAMTDTIILAELTGYCPQLYDALLACVCAYVDRDVSLAGLDLSNEAQTFVGADFSRTDLTRANFTHSNLTAANFTGATLDYTDMSYATLNNAVFAHSGDKVLYAPICQMRFYGAKLIGAHFSHLHFVHAKFGYADMANAVFADTRLTDTLMQNAGLINAIFQRGYLTRVSMVGVDIKSAKFYNTRFEQVDLTGAYAYGVRASNSWVKSAHPRDPSDHISFTWDNLLQYLTA
jgi:uncharacterized protein YjbI with pentapeptide repeats